MSRNLERLIEQVWLELGGRGTARDVYEHVRPSLAPEVEEALVEKAVMQAIGAFFRRKDRESGLNVAPEIDSHGTHADISLLDEHELRYVVAQHMNAGKAHMRKARRYADLARQRFGVVIDLANPLGEEDAG